MNTADKKFLKEMIAHHEMAIKMSKMVLMDGEDSQVKKMAKGIISAQETEISQMRAMLKDEDGGEKELKEMLAAISDFLKKN